ncbi:MAG: hypothetical protein HY530_06315 [Chloroflexi bacterium]|nr:hypothetical protein [Chloroflexota bacterium]
MVQHPVEILEQVESLGGRLDHEEQLERLLKVGFDTNVDKEAEYVTSQTGVIVTPGSCCYGFLTKARLANSPNKVKSLAEILCESMNKSDH